MATAEQNSSVLSSSPDSTLSATTAASAATSAARAASNASTPTDELFLPDSYEEYLPLSEPSSVAVTENYTAIADGLNIYVYDRLSSRYRCYTHPEITDKKITQIQFDDTGTLYFSVQSMDLYALNADTLTASKTNFACNAFDIYGDYVYYTAISGAQASIYSRRLDDLDGERQEIVPPEIVDKPAIAHNGEALYYTDAGIYLSRADDKTYSKKLYSPQGGQSSAVQSIAFYGDYCFYTDTTKTLYSCRYASADAAPETIGENCSAVSSPYAGSIYVVCGKAVKRLNAETREFTDYEISASSPSAHRLEKATDCVLLNDTLVTLDSGESGTRIHLSPVGSTTTPSKTLNLSTVGAKFLATDGKTACVATDSEGGALAIYDLTAKTDASPLRPIAQIFADPDESFVGIACVYGTYYAATNNTFFCLSPAENAEETTEKYTVFSRDSGKSVRLLTSDAYGALYAAHSDLVYTYTEAEFLDENTSKAPADAVAKLPASIGGDTVKKMLVDFDRNIYALQGNSLIACETTSGGVARSYPLNTEFFVYTQTADTPVTSVAFGVETSEIYVLFDGTFIAKTYAAPLPTVSSIEVNGADETLFAEESATFSVVACEEKTLLVRFDSSMLYGKTFFPYLSRERTKRKISALALTTSGRFTVLAVYDEENNDYYTALAETASCMQVSADDYLKDPPAQFSGGSKGYLTNSISLYKYPYLTPLFTVDTLDRHAEITVLKRVEHLDWLYYQVQYTDADGSVKIGYLPAAYVSDTDGRTPAADTKLLGTTNDRSDLIWRLAYLILGTLAICILVDYLILRRYDKD